MFVLFSRPVLTKIRNEPKQPETSQSDPKKIVKQPETSQIFKIGEIRNFLLAFVFQTSSPNPQIWVFEPRSINFLIFHVACTLFRRWWFQIWHCFSKLRAQMPKFGHFESKHIKFLTLTKFRRCLFQIWNWFSNILNPNLQILAFWVKMYQLSKLNEILPVPYCKGVDFRFWSDIGFRKFWAQMLKFNLGILDQKSKLFLISAKFQIYPISKVLISKSDTCLKILHTDPQMRVFWVKSVNFLILREFCMYAISLFRCWRQSWYS